MKRLAGSTGIREHGAVTDGEMKKEAAAADEPAALEAVEPPAREAVVGGDPEGVGETPDAVFNTLWKRVLDAWDDDKPHQLALSYALEHEMLPEIAGRYRFVLALADP